MSAAFAIRPTTAEDAEAVHALLAQAFGQAGEAKLVDDLRADGDIVLELGTWADDRLVGSVVFSRLFVEQGDLRIPAVALAPVATAPDMERQGIAGALIEAAHVQLHGSGETLSVVLGEPAYYGRFGYRADRAAAFECPWKGPYLQAMAWGDAPEDGNLVYAPAFGRL